MKITIKSLRVRVLGMVALILLGVITVSTAALTYGFTSAYTGALLSRSFTLGEAFRNTLAKSINLGLPLDSLVLPKRVSLVKIDAEGHELSVLRGMESLLHRDRPVLIVEVSSSHSREFLVQRGYAVEKLPASPNCIFRPD